MLSSILDHRLYIGDYRYSDGSIALNKNVSIVNCTKNLPFAYPQNAHIRVPVDDIDADTENNTMLAFLFETCEFIHNEIQNGKIVIVHCQQGLSRSPSVVVAFLMKYHNMSFEEATQYVRERRPGALTFAVNFAKCLVNWEKIIYQQ